MSDIFKAGYGKELTKIAEKLFIRQNGYSDWDFSPGKGNFKLAQEFYLTENGIVFSYNQYEIGPYAAGMPEVIGCAVGEGAFGQNKAPIEGRSCIYGFTLNSDPKKINCKISYRAIESHRICSFNGILLRTIKYRKV